MADKLQEQSTARGAQVLDNFARRIDITSFINLHRASGVNGKNRSPLLPSPVALPGFTCRDLYADYTPPPFVIYQMIDQGEFVVVFGESDTMKTFFVLDMLMHIATGTEYHGKPVTKGGVLLIVGEGSGGIKRRVKAWLIANKIKKDDPQPLIYVATRPASLFDDPDTISATIKEAETVLACKIAVVAFDTLAANFGPGDENRTGDMNTAIHNAKRASAGRAILFIHHSGLADKNRERGSSVLKAAADVRIMVERVQHQDHDVIVASCKKIKDGPEFASMAFQWRAVELGWQDARRQQLTSVVLDRTDVPKRAKAETKPEGKVQVAIMAALHKHGAGMRKPDLVDVVVKADQSERPVSSGSVYNAIKRLREDKTLIEVAGVVAISKAESPA